VLRTAVRSNELRRSGAVLLKQGKLGAIDALRGYAILGVIIVHVGQRVGGSVEAWTFSGRFGVQLFFIISAFTLTKSWIERQQTPTEFYIRRAFRIAPMFWLATSVFALIDASGPRLFTLSDVALSAGFLFWLHPATNNLVVPGGWSIGVEVCFYAIFPLLIGAVRSLRSSVLLVIVSLLLFRILKTYGVDILAAIYPTHPNYLLSAYLWTTLPLNFLAFAIGIFCYYASVSGFAEKYEQNTPLLLSVIAALSALLLIEVTAIFITLGAVVLFSTAASKNFLDNVMARRLGEISYSAYFVHFLFVPRISQIVIDQLDIHGWTSFALIMVCVTAATAACSSLTYWFIEQKFILLGSLAISKIAAQRS